MNRLLALGLLAAAVEAAPLLVNRSATSFAFEGIGGLSGGGATSRLLVDYPEPQRSQILDYLFKPNFGASLHMLKVEIGGDSQSTDGTETSHMHTKDDLDLTRGYEWWLMVEAKKRNPDIKLYGLPWAFPGWVGNDPETGIASNSPFTYPNQTSSYIMQWVKGAKSQWNLEIDYIGIWNERASTSAYAQSLKNTLSASGFGNVKLIAKDGDAGICNSLAADPAYAAAIDIVGLHYPSDYGQDGYKTCHALNKPLWASEESSSYDDFNGAACWARVIHSHYVLSGITCSIMWNLVGSYYHGTNWYASSMMTAVQPWSGYWENLEVVWATAHVTQFSKVGWNYLKVGNGSGQLPQGGYYTTMVDDQGSDFSMWIVKISHEHAPCTRPGLPSEVVNSENVTFQLAGFSGVQSLQVRYSNYEDQDKPQFISLPPVTVASDGTFTVEVKVGAYLTLSTITTSVKGNYTSPASSPSLPLPHSDNFNSYPVGQEAKWWTDQIGAYEIQPDSQNSSNFVMRQMVPQLPIGWSDAGSQGPFTLLGMKEWYDVAVETRFRLPSADAAGCVSTRSNQMWANGIVFCVGGNGVWNLTYQGPPQNGVFTEKPVATGTVRSPGVLTWHTLKLS
ncbi:putative galactocerebrosidase, partial [Diplonema papillatum]